MSRDPIVVCVRIKNLTLSINKVMQLSGLTTSATSPVGLLNVLLKFS